MAEGPMIVVAKSAGYYGDKPRQAGERFAIKTARHFSKNWMADPSKEETGHLEAQYTSPGRTRDVSDEQLLSEVADAVGAVAALREENARLKQRIRKLEQEIAHAEERAAAAESAGIDEGASEGESEPPADEGPGAAGAASAAGEEDGEGADEGRAPRRVTRRRTK